MKRVDAMMVRAFAPASVANVAVGFDLLGFSVDVAGDIVTVAKINEPTVRIGSIKGIAADITLDPAKNTATAGLIKLREDLKLKFGFQISIEKGIPLGSGMGGSAASAVAAIFAANALLKSKLTNEQMVSYALIGEAQASGSFHADNIAPCLVGGMTLARVLTSPSKTAVPRVEITSLPLPKGLYCVLILPELSVETKQARGILKTEVSLKNHIAQSANLAGFMSGCYTSNLDLIGRSLSDLIVEPQRAHLIPGFSAVKEAALNSGALGCSISGAGPSIFALVKNKKTAAAVKTAMLAAFERHDVKATAWAVPATSKGARVLK